MSEQYSPERRTAVVLTGTGLLGFAAGVLGCFTLLRKRALMGDALSHATLPGIGLAFMLSVLAGGTGKSLPILLAGATASGVLGLATILVIRNFTRLKEDTALGIVIERGSELVDGPMKLLSCYDAAGAQRTHDAFRKAGIADCQSVVPQLVITLRFVIGIKTACSVAAVVVIAGNFKSVFPKEK